MRIVNRKEFLQMPEGTLFAKYRPCVFSDLMIKGETIHGDFYCQDIASAIDCDNTDEFANSLEKARLEGISLTMDFESEGRDGCFDEEQLFAVWERADVEQLIKRLQDTLK